MRRWTYPLAMAAAQDTANAQMRKAGRTRWNLDDWNLSVDVFERLFPLATDLRERCQKRKEQP